MSSHASPEPHPKADELDFAAFARTGDTEALARVFDRTAPKLVLIAMHAVNTAEEAEDLLQITFLEAMKNADRYDPNRPLIPWLTSILAHRGTDMKRAAIRARQRGEARAAQDLTMDGDDPAELAESRELLGVVAAAIDEMSPSYRQILSLHLVHGLRPVEIARTNGSSPDTVRSQLRRGMELLRAKLPANLAVPALTFTLSQECLANVRQVLLTEAGAVPVPVPVPVPDATPSTITQAHWMQAGVVALALATSAFFLGWFDRTTDSTTPEVTAAPTVTPDRVGTPIERQSLQDPLTESEKTSAPEWQWRVVHAADGRLAAGEVVTVAGLWELSSIRVPIAVTTDDAGIIDASQFSAGPYWLVHSKKDRVMAHVGKSTTLRIRPGFLLRGEVIDGQGRPVPGADIWMSNGPDGMSGRVVTQADTAGRFALPNVPNQRWMMARTATHSWSARYLVTGRSDTTCDLVIRLLHPARRIHGVVRDAAGMPVADADVVALQPLANPDGMLSKPARPYQLRTDALGRYTLEHVGRGSWDVRVRHAGRRLAVHAARVEVEEHDVQHDVTLTRGWSLSGVVRDQSGKRVPDTDLLIGVATLLHVTQARTDAAGRYRVEGLAPGETQIRTFNRRFGRASSFVVGAAGEAKTCNITLERGIAVEGRIVDEAGEPQADWILNFSGPRCSAGTGRTSADGTFRVTSLVDKPPYRLLAAPVIYQPPHLVAMGLQSGNVGDLVVKAAHRPAARIVGTIVTSNGTPPKQASVSLETTYGWHQHTYVDERTGRFVFDDAVAGASRLHFRSRQGASTLIKKLDLSSDSHEDIGVFTLPDAGSLLVRLRGAKQPGPLTVHLVNVDARITVPVRTTSRGIESTKPLNPGRHRLVVYGPKVLQRIDQFELEPGERSDRDVKIELGTPIRLQLSFKNVFRAPELMRVQAWDATETLRYEGTEQPPYKAGSRFALAPGNYTLRFQAISRTTLEVIPDTKLEKKLVVGTEPIEMTVEY